MTTKVNQNLVLNNIMTILVADDHELITSGIHNFLSKELDNVVIKSAQNITELKDVLSSQKVDILLQDIRFGNDHALSFITEIKQVYPDILIIALSSLTDNFTVNSILNAGCLGYVSKSAPMIEIIKAIEAVSNHQKYISKDLRLEKSIDKKSNEIKLTAREKEVLLHIQQGLSTKQIADKIFLSVKTVEGYRSSLFVKFNVKNVAELVKETLLLGIV
jgi:DNA-binding NarL/FixJ family response regulator